MTQDEFAQAVDGGNAKFLQPDPAPIEPAKQPSDIEDYTRILSILRRPIRHVTSVPSYTPKSWIESFVFYDNGATRRIYIYVNATWRYVVLN